MPRYLNIRHALVALATCCCLTGNAHTQSPATQEPIWVNGDNNETTKAELDLLGQQADPDQLIIMIARLGSGE